MLFPKAPTLKSSHTVHVLLSKAPTSKAPTQVLLPKAPKSSQKLPHTAFKSSHSKSFHSFQKLPLLPERLFPPPVAAFRPSHLIVLWAQRRTKRIPSRNQPESISSGCLLFEIAQYNRSGKGCYDTRGEGLNCGSSESKVQRIKCTVIRLTRSSHNSGSFRVMPIGAQQMHRTGV